MTSAEARRIKGSNAVQTPSSSYSVSIAAATTAAQAADMVILKGKKPRVTSTKSKSIANKDIAPVLHNDVVLAGMEESKVKPAPSQMQTGKEMPVSLAATLEHIVGQVKLSSINSIIVS